MGCGDDLQRIGPEDAADAGPDAEPEQIDREAPLAAIVFPPADALTDVADLVIRGTASDSDGIAAVRVNGAEATTSDGFASWRATLALDHGINAIVVETEDIHGNVDTTAAQVRLTLSANPVFRLDAIAMDPDNERLLITDRAAGVLTVNPVSGERTVIASDTVGSGPALDRALAVAWDAKGRRVVVADELLAAVVAIDLESGVRTIVADGTVGSGPSLNRIRGLAVRSSDGAVFGVDPFARQVLRIDPASGDRVVVSGPTAGGGPAFASLSGIALDEPNGRALVTDCSARALLAVDLVTGDRSVISDGTVTSGGALLECPRTVMLDAPNSRALILDITLNAVFAVDVATGFRTLVTGNGAGAGPELRRTSRAAFDPARGQVVIIDDDELLIAADAATGERALRSHFTFGTGAYQMFPRSILWDTATDRVYVGNYEADFGDEEISMVGTIELGTGNRAVLSGVADGPPMDDPTGMALNGDTLYVADEEEETIFAVDVNTGERTVVSREGVGTGPGFFPSGFDYDRASNRLLASSGGDNFVLSIDPATGDRTVITSDDVGGGFPMTRPFDVVADPDNNRLLVPDLDSDTLLAIDPTTGIRFQLSPPDGTHVFTFPFVSGELDPPNGRLLVATDRQLFAIDLDTGERSLVASPERGRGVIRELGALFALPERQLAASVDTRLKSALIIDLTTGDRVILSR